MEKPKIYTETYYDWDEAFDYLKSKYKILNEDKIWNRIVDTEEIHNGQIFTLSNWEMVFEDGKFTYLAPKWWWAFIEKVMNEFGEVDTECLTTGTKTCKFRASW